MKKRILSIVMALAMMLSLMPTALAADIPEKGYDGASLPEVPTVSGDVITVTPENAQYTLDGAYGDINGKTIHFSAGTYTNVLVLARPTKYEGSETNYYKKVSGGFEPQDISQLEGKGVYWYDRTMSGVTFTADEGVVLPGFTSHSGHVYQSAYDYVRDIAVVDTNTSYYASCSLENITFQNLTISGQVWLNDYSESNYSKNAVNRNITFDGCTFTGDTKKMAADKGFAAIKTNADSKYYSNITVRNCTIKDYYQGIYIQGVNGATIANNYIRNTTHNTIALQSSKSNPVKGTVVICENVIDGAKDRAIRFGEVLADCDIAINNNVMANSGDSDGELIKASSVPDSKKVSLEHNYWSGTDLKTAVQSFAYPESVGVIGGTFLVNPSTGLAYGYSAVLTNGKYVVETLNTDNAVAAIGSTLYGTLQQAVEDADSEDTIKLTRDIDWVRDTTILNLSNKTLDLNQHKISAINFTLIFEGENCTIKNGYLDSKGGSYALFIGENPTKHFLVEDVTAVGGINIYNAQNVILRNVDVTATDYYAVWCDEGGQAVIENGVFKAAENTKALLGMSATDTVLEIKDGYFNAKDKPLALEGNDEDGKPYRHPIITGGYFTSDPTAYLAENKVALPGTEPGYAFTVGDKVTTETVVEPAAGDPVVDMSAIPNESKDAAEAVAKSVEDNGELAAAANSVLNTVTEEEKAAAEQALENALGEKENITTYVQTYLDIKPTAYDAGNKTFTLDITPMYRVVASTAGSATDIKVVGEVDSGANAVVLKGSETELNSLRTMTISVTLPDDWTGTEVYVQHKGHEYVATVKDKVATFTNPHGFSEFVISVAPAAVAEVNGERYMNLTDALNAAKDKDTVIILKAPDVNTNFTMSGDSREITVQNGTDSEITVKINGKDYTLAKKNATGDSVKITYTRPSSGGSSSSSYTVNVEDSKNGTVTASHKSASKNTTVTLTVKADKGYELDDLTVTDKNGKEIKLTDKGNGKYTFTMPAGKVDVKATFAKIVEAPAYSDVSASAWYADAVAYVTDKGMMEGDSGKFMPLDKLTRSQMAQVLFNLEGKKSVNYALTFGDMNGTEWYAEAVRWAASEQIVNGYDNGNFGPNDPITREQLVTVLYRYAQYKGLDTATTEENLTSFADAAQVSGYAVSAMNWAVGAGVINGTDSGLAPKATATRAEVAQILMNFDQKF